MTKQDIAAYIISCFQSYVHLLSVIGWCVLVSGLNFHGCTALLFGDTRSAVNDNFELYQIFKDFLSHLIAVIFENQLTVWVCARFYRIYLVSPKPKYD